MEANKILSADVLDLVFEGRNKEYGAYDLRKSYNKRIITALVVTGSVALLALIGSVLANRFSGPEEQFKKTEVTLQEIPPEEEKKELPPPPPPPPPEPPKIETKQFTPPKIVKDEEVQEPPPPQEELKDTKIADISQEGIKDDQIATPEVIDQGKQVIEEKKVVEPEIFEKVEIEASFPGGEAKWRQFLERNCNGQVASDNGAPAGNYTVYIQFVVDKDGNISDIKPLTNHGYGMEAEAARVIKKGPKWTPAVQNGRSVKAYRKQPITFQVEDN